MKRTKNITYNNLLYLLLITVSFLSTIDNFALQTAIDGGIIISEKVKYPEDFSNVTSIYYNGWTMLHHVTFVLIKTNLNPIIISKILMFISVNFLTFGIFYLVQGLTKSKLFALIISLGIIISKINFGDTDYPTMFFSEHSYGMFSMSTFTLIVGLLFNGNFKLAGFFIILLTSFHLVVGLWLIFLLFLLFFFLAKFKNDNYNYLFKSLIFGCYISLIPVLISFIFFQFGTLEKTSFDSADFETYLKIWDHHRNLKDINYNYLFKTFILIFLYSYVFFNLLKKYKNHNFLFYFILINCLGSMIIYLFYKFFPNIMPELFIRAMPTRIFLLHSIIGYPLIMSFLYILFIQKFKIISIKKNLGKFSFLAVFVFTAIFLLNLDIFKKLKNNPEKITKRINKFSNNLSNKLEESEQIFWNKVKILETNGYFVTTLTSSDMVLRFGNKPYIINAKFFDHLPYHPYTASEVKLIVENIYSIDFENPPKKYWPEIRDNWIKKKFEKRSEKEWKKLANDFNLSGVIVPNTWNLKLKKELSSNKFNLYLF